MREIMADISKRFRGYLPVIIDVETGGVNPLKDALLELAAIPILMDENGKVYFDQYYHYHIAPFENAHLDPASLAFNKIDPFHPFRFAVSEEAALADLFTHIQAWCDQTHCQRAVLVGHNAWFDQHFLNAAVRRCKINKNPFHRFTSLDTATLGALAYGQTVLSKVLKAAEIPYDSDKAHSALYDAQCTAALFCHIVNRWPLA
jgi:ribonuclease T